MKVFNTKFELGSYISGQGDVGVPTAAPFVRLEKGLCIDFNGSSSLITTSLNPRLSLSSGGAFTAEFYLFYKGGGGNQVILGDAVGGTDRWFFGMAGDNYWIGLGDNLDDTGQPVTQNRWIHVLVVYDGTDTKIYEDNTLANTNTFVFAGTYTEIANIAEAAGLFGNIKLAKIEVNNRVLTEKERSQAYSDFLNAPSLLAEKYPKTLPEDKPRSLNDPDLSAAFNMIPSPGGVLTDISGSGNNGTITGAISSVSGLVFDGVDDRIDLGADLNLGTVHTVNVRIRTFNIADANGYVLGDVTGNFFILRIRNSTSALFYKTTGGASATVSFTPTIAWQNISVIRNGTSIDFYINGVQQGTTQTLGDNGDGKFRYIANISAVYLNCEIADLKIYSRAFTQNEAIEAHNAWNRVVLRENFLYDPVGATVG